MGNTGMLGKVQIEGDWTQKRLILTGDPGSARTHTACVARYRADDDLRETQGHDPPPRSCPVQSQLDEFEHAVGGGGKPSGFDIEVLKDRRGPVRFG